MPKRPLIIDTDTGCGFVHAAMLVAGCGLFDIKGACTVYGSTTAKRAAVHAAYLRDLCADYYPVVSGAEKPILVRRKNSMSPDDCSALEDTEGMYTFSPDPEERAWDFIYRTAVSLDGEAELFCTGPLTNIAIAVIRHRDLPRFIKRITIAAGTSREGNATAYAEYNVYSDPHAFKCVLDAGFRQVDLVELEFCGTAFLNSNDTERIPEATADNIWKSLLGSCERRRETSVRERSLVQGVADPAKTYWHDAAAAFALAIPAAVSASNVYAMVELRSEISSGRTLFDFNRRFTDDPNVRLALYTQREMFADFYFRCLRTFDRRKGG